MEKTKLRECMYSATGLAHSLPPCLTTLKSVNLVLKSKNLFHFSSTFVLNIFSLIYIYMYSKLCTRWVQAVCNKIGSVCITLRHDGITLYLLGYTTSQIPYHPNRTLLWRINVTSDSKTYLGPHIKCQILTKFRNSQQIFKNMPNIKFHINLSSGSCPNIC